MPLTALKCQNAKPLDKPYKLTDGLGLFLLVQPTGSKYWRWKYRTYDKEKVLALGVYPEVSLADARDLRDDARRKWKNGIDPSAERKQNKLAGKLNSKNTFKALAEEWHAHNYDTWDKRHADNILNRLRNDIFPDIGSIPIRELTPVSLYACIKKIEDRGAPEMAKRAMQICGQILRYAVVTGRAERDFTKDLKGSLKKHKPGHYAAIEIDQLPAFLKQLQDNDERLFKQTKLAIKLMLLTFVRTSELINARWDEFNFEKNLWINQRL